MNVALLFAVLSFGDSLGWIPPNARPGLPPSQSRASEIILVHGYEKSNGVRVRAYYRRIGSHEQR